MTCSSASWECTPLSRDGRRITVDISAMMITYEGKPAILIIAHDMTEIQHQIAALRRRDNLLQGIATTSHLLLTCTTLADVVPKVIRTIGEVTGADRTIYYEICGSDESGLWSIRQKYEWTREGIFPLSTDPVCRELVFHDHESIFRTLADGRIIEGFPGDLSGVSPPVPKPAGLSTVLLVPVFVRSQFAGIIGFTANVVERPWAVPEKTILSALAADIGSTIERLESLDYLRISQQNFATLFDSIEDLLFVLDEAGRILHVNKAACTSLGYSSRELTGMDLMSVHPPEHQKEAAAVIHDSINGSRKPSHIPLLRKNGAYMPVETHLTRGTWDDRTVLFGTCRAISHRAREGYDSRLPEENHSARVDIFK